MPQNFIQVDNFLPDPEQFRASALAESFRNVKFGAEVYKRVQIRDFNEHNELLSAVMKRPVEQEYTLTRLNYSGEFPNHAIHSDNACGEWAAVLYLNPTEQCSGGTAFWRHKATGLSRFSETEIRRTGKSPARLLAQLTPDWNRPEAWEQTGMAEMKFNRLIVYSGRDFHSRWPLEAFGTTPQDGRLIWCSFFQ